jgi:hypothetical protein
MSKLLILFLFLGLPLSLAQTDSGKEWEFPDAKWTAVSSSGGVMLQRWKTDEMTTAAFKAEVTLDAPIAQVLSVLRATDRRSEWTPRVKEARIVERKSSTRWLELWHLGTPIVVKDRYFVLDIRVLFDPITRKVTIPFRSAETSAPVPDGLERATAHRGSYVIEPIDGGNRTRFTYQAHVDLGGSVPKWMTSAIETDYPVDTVKSLRAKLAKGDIAEDPRIKAFLEGKSGSLESALAAATN